MTYEVTECKTKRQTSVIYTTIMNKLLEKKILSFNKTVIVNDS